MEIRAGFSHPSAPSPVAPTPQLRAARANESLWALPANGLWRGENHRGAQQLWKGSLCVTASPCSAEIRGHRATPNTKCSATSAENPWEGMWKVGTALGGRKWEERKSLAKANGDA